MVIVYDLANETEHHEYGPNRELRLSETAFHIEEIATAPHQFELTLTNSGSSPILLAMKLDENLTSTQPSNVVVPANGSATIPLVLRPQPGDHAYQLHLHSDSIDVHIPIASFGYHLSSDVFNAGKKQSSSSTNISRPICFPLNSNALMRSVCLVHL